METVRREETTEVLDTGAPVSNTNTNRTADMTTHQTVTSSGDPYAVRRNLPLKVQNSIYLLVGILQGLLGIRFLLGLFGANPAAGFAQLIYGITGPFIAPFVGLFGQPRFQGQVLDLNSLVAIVVYGLIAWVLVKIVWLVMGDSRRGVRTISSQIDTRSR